MQLPYVLCEHTVMIGGFMPSAEVSQTHCYHPARFEPYLKPHSVFGGRGWKDVAFKKKLYIKKKKKTLQ